MAAVREAATRESQSFDNDDDLFRWFTSRVQRHLHIVFTMNPASADFGNRAATSPALFNRCVVRTAVVVIDVTMLLYRTVVMVAAIMGCCESLIAVTTTLCLCMSPVWHVLV